MADATYVREGNDILVTLEAAANAYELRQLMDGRAGWMQGVNAATADEQKRFRTDAIINVPKASIVLLAGGRAYFDRSARVVTFRPVNDRDYYLGTVYADAAADDATATVILGAEQSRIIDLSFPDWTTEATNGLGVTPLIGNAAKLEFDAVSEAAQAAIYSERTFPILSNAILECRIKVVSNGDNASLDFDIGMANGTHATDFETIAEFASFHFDGNALSLYCQSDDGSTDVAAADTLVDFALGTTIEGWIDARDKDNVKFYLDGVRVCEATTFKLTAAAGPLKAIALMEKTSDDTVADVRVMKLGVRISEQ